MKLIWAHLHHNSFTLNCPWKEKHKIHRHTKASSFEWICNAQWLDQLWSAVHNSGENEK